MARLITLLLVLLLAPCAALSQTGANTARPITSGCTDPATSKDYGATIVWRSAASCSKTETLPACGPYNNGKWIQVVDGQRTAAAQPITINATAGTVSGPVNPVVINLNGGGWIVTCDGAATTWTVTGTSTAMTPPATGVSAGSYQMGTQCVTIDPQGRVTTVVTASCLGSSSILRNGGGHLLRNAGGSVLRNVP
jgi:hypothetical protein